MDISFNDVHLRISQHREKRLIGIGDPAFSIPEDDANHFGLNHAPEPVFTEHKCLLGNPS